MPHPLERSQWRQPRGDGPRDVSHDLWSVRKRVNRPRRGRESHRERDSRIAQKRKQRRNDLRAGRFRRSPQANHELRENFTRIIRRWHRVNATRV